MRPIELRFACFGPYVQEQIVDFAALEKEGLFLICGETGAGKTTILDAICYALYGRSSGGLRGDISVMRCKIAQKEQETYVSFTFESGNHVYCFTRSLKYGRKNLNDSHNCLIQEGDSFVPIFENPKATAVNREAERIIGLTYEQFRQVIVLPQGQFERLLVSDSAEKEKILVSLFHADRWQKITEELARRVQEQDSQLKQERQQITMKLKEYRCDSLEALEHAALVQQSQVETLTEQTVLEEKELQAARLRNQQAMLENRDFEELETRRKHLAGLQARRSSMDREEELLKKADQAETILPQYRNCQQALQQKLKAAQQEQTAAEAQTAAKQELERLSATRKKLDESRESLNRMKQEIVLLENVVPVYETLPEKERAEAAARQAVRTGMEAAEKAKQSFKTAEDSWILAQERQRRAYEEYSRTQTAYLKNIGSTLAKELVEGQPCPVCGSRNHPSPAQPTAQTVTAQEVDEKNQALEQATRAVTQTAQKRMQAEKRNNEAQEALNLLQQTAAAAQQALEAARQQRFAKIETLEQLKKQIKVRKNQIEKYEAAESGWQQAWNQASANELACTHQLEEKIAARKTAETEYDTAQEEWQKALSDSGLGTEAAYRSAVLAPQERQRRRMVLTQYHADLNHAEEAFGAMSEALKDRQAPDLEACRKQVQQLEQQYRSSTERLILGKNLLEAMGRDMKQLKTRLEAYAIARRDVDADLDFANRLRGRSGISLQRYVLGVMLTAITVEANRLLKGIYGGRYQLFRTDAISGSGHKGGLELEVYDSQNSQRRSVTTLSGGEKFLVALSLAIGLSTVVQAQGQGIRLEAMFIDEGFGSLDREAVLDALEVLRGIQRSSGTVGIISHVETLAEIIPTRLEVRKGTNGSNLVVK